MATSYYKLDIETRESVGKKATKAIRRDGKIPSTLYFKGDEPESISIDKIKLYQALKSDQRVYEVELGGESQYVMVKAVQYHPVTDENNLICYRMILYSFYHYILRLTA